MTEVLMFDICQYLNLFNWNKLKCFVVLIDLHKHVIDTSYFITDGWIKTIIWLFCDYHHWPIIMID